MGGVTGEETLGGEAARDEGEGNGTYAAPILVVDDHPMVRTALERMFKAAGYRVVSCADGLAALEACRSERFGCIVLDLRMPGLDGHGFLEASATELAGGSPPVVLTSSDIMAGMMERWPCVVATVLKPFTADEMLDAVDRAMGLQMIRA